MGAPLFMYDRVSQDGAAPGAGLTIRVRRPQTERAANTYRASPPDPPVAED